MARIRHLAQVEGFVVHEKNTRVLRRNTAQIVTGLVVNETPHVPRDTIRHLRAILHRAKTDGLAKQNREGRTNYRQWLEVMIGYVQMVQPAVGLRFREHLAAVSD